MKKTIYTIIAALIALTSCQKELSGPQNEHPGRYAEGRATLHFKVSTGASDTKAGAFADEAKVNTLRLVVFDEEGFVSEVVPATLDETGKKSGEYVATLALSYEHRTIHFIANYTGTIPFGTAEDAIATLYTSDKYDAYWQMVDMPDGITVKADNNGDPILDSGNNMVFDDSVISALDNIVLIRNYAKFTITSASDSNLQIESACVVGTANKGAVAPYNREKSDFVTNYANYTYPADLIAALEYNGCIPESAVPTTITDAVWADAVSGACTIYSYERELPLSNPPFILVKGKYGTTAAERSAASSTYYKINLRDSAENYFPILRNYNYKINIKNVAKAGEATIQDAIDGPGSGDISTDINFLDLTNISNGEARIFVSFTDKVLVSGNAIQLKYKFIPNMANPNTTANGDVTITKGESGYFGPIFPATGNTDVVITTTEDSDHYRIVTLDPRDPDQYNRTQTLTLTGHYTDKNGEAATISRIISFTLRQKPDIQLSCSEVASAAGWPLHLSISIPGGLSKSMFPLDMLIEAEQNSLSPNNNATNATAKNLPVRYGKSMFDEDIPGYHFVRQITWDEYEAATVNSSGYKTFLAEFVTTMDESSTNIKVRNADYFTDGNTSFTVASAPLDNIKVYINYTNGTDDASDWIQIVGADVTGKGFPAQGQTYYLYGYINEYAKNLGLPVTIGGNTAAPTGGTLIVSGETYYQYKTKEPSYYMTYGVKTQSIECAGKSASRQVPVFRISHSSTLGNNAPSTSTWYILYNTGRSRYVYNTGTTLAMDQTDNNFASLMKFTSTGNTTQLISAKNEKYVVGTTGNFSFSDSAGTTYEWQNNHTRLRSSESTNYFWYGTSNSTVAMSNSTSNTGRRSFTFYPVTIIDPR